MKKELKKYVVVSDLIAADAYLIEAEDEFEAWAQTEKEAIDCFGEEFEMDVIYMDDGVYESNIHDAIIIPLEQWIEAGGKEEDLIK